MTFLKQIPLIIILLGTAPLSYAQSKGDMVPSHMPPPMHHHGTFLTFSTTGQAKVIPTELTLNFSAEITHKSPIEAQQKLNQLVDNAVSLAKTYKDVTLHTNQYSIEQDFLQQHNPKNWNAHQNLILTSHDTKTLFELAAKLQNQGLLLNAMQWELDDTTRAELERKAEHNALEKIRPEIEEDAKILGMKLVNIDHIQIGSESFAPPPLMRANFMTMKTADLALSHAPQTTADIQNITIEVTIRAYLEKTQ